MMIRNAFIVLIGLLMAGCGGTGGAPESPRIYVIGVDASRSFWQVGTTTQRKPASLTREKTLEIIANLRDNINKINVVSDEKNFVLRTQRESGDFVKQFDREGLRKAIENATDMIVTLANGASNAETRVILAEEVEKSLTAISIALTKFDYERSKKLEKFDDALNPQSVQRIKTALERAKGELDKFTYAVTVADNPETITTLSHQVVSLVDLLAAKIQERNALPRDPQWTKMGIYGSIVDMNAGLFFLVGTSTGTVCQPSAGELNESLRRLTAQSIATGGRAFAPATDYGAFYRRSFMEIQNLMTTWGAFDKDIGIELRYIIIGDGRHDPVGVSESAPLPDKSLIDPVKELFKTSDPSMSVLNGVPWENIKSVSVTFLAPKKQYNTDVLDHWTKTLQEAIPDKKAQVRYFMFDALQDSGSYNFNIEKLKLVLE